MTWRNLFFHKFNLYLELIRWRRPAGSFLLLWPTLSALWIAAKGFPGWHLLMVFTLGTVLMRSSGCCINDMADAEFDRAVERTKNRPVTTGALSRREALGLGLILALLAFVLVCTTHTACIALSPLALALACIYPFSKRWFAMPQAILGIAFSMGIPMAFAAVYGNAWPAHAWLIALLFVGNLFWVLAYDTEYAMVDRNDDLRIGIRTSAITLGAWDTRAVAIFYALHAGCWAWVYAQWVMPHSTLAMPAKTAILMILILLVAAQIVRHLRLIAHRKREDCLRAFQINHYLGLSFFLGIVALLAGR